ncbi:MAG: sulfatase-like hydrolase/transferase, partial [Prolixibacteraceae bacterium]
MKKITGIITGTICLSALSTLCTAQEKNQQPNIIFMLADDMRYDELSYVGKPVLKTPNLDYLAENGTWFNNSYVTTSICVVSRVSIMTGMYARRHGIYEFYEPINDTLWQQ